MEMSKVWLVGAGPGTAGLLTLKGAKVLEQAHVVLYDRLVGDEVLAMIPQGAKVIDVGKKAGNHTIPQEEIGRILAEEALKGQRVVRLKGGDPFLFGRGGEELEILVEKKIPFEVVPGVTSPIAVPAYGGIPVTHRDMASALHIITGHRREGKDYDIDFEGLVRAGGTLVFLMGIASLPLICERLMAAGLEGSTPAAVVQQGTTSGQKVISASLDTIEEQVKLQGVETPAIILVGEVCSLADRYNWFERLPLFGRKILVTRPAEKDSVLTSKLRELGAEVLEIPAIQIEPI
ncbi:MAG: uroporphyrinogen-III C-methyltransferase, partial [Firmicutes bacterium]|nr:uroporphyrinogen-III C-methyltransferase [Bacillota bacterium]